MTRTILCAAALWSILAASAGTVSFNNPAKVYAVTAPGETHGYDAIYMLDGLKGMSMTYTPTTPGAEVSWSRYTDEGEAYATAVSGVVCDAAGRYILRTLADQTSYSITEGNTTLRVRIIDYTPLKIDLPTFAVADAAAEGSCGDIRLTCTGAGPIRFSSPVATSYTLSRELKVSYPVLQARVDEESGRETLASADTTLTLGSIAAAGALVPSPCQPAQVTLQGDRFLEAFAGVPQQATAQLHEVSTVVAAVNAVQLNALADNVKPVAADATRHYGGSAPVEMEFEAEVNEAATFVQWQVSAVGDFSNIAYNYPYEKLTETFTATGTTYVRFYAAGADGACPYVSPVFVVDIGESALECPNAFSPNDDGVNDMWRVSYRSITEFDCHIFNRWGQQVARFTDPADGWDGKIGSKKAPAGVYYYIIKAKGSDGKDYKLSGDINIIYYR